MQRERERETTERQTDTEACYYIINGVSQSLSQLVQLGGLLLCI